MLQVTISYYQHTLAHMSTQAECQSALPSDSDLLLVFDRALASCYRENGVITFSRLI